VGFENPCFEHRHWTFEWAAACLRGTRPAWQACLTLGRRQASPGTRPAAASLPNPSGDGKPTWHEATMASLPNPWGGGKPTWHEASMARLPSHSLFFVFLVSIVLLHASSSSSIIIHTHIHTYTHQPSVHKHHPSPCIIHTYTHTYIHTYIHTSLIKSAV